jgi:hypothetical protein
MIAKANLPVPVPAVDHHLIEVMQSLGWVADRAPLTAVEIGAWADGTGESLTPWEFETIRAMSRAFVAGLRAKDAPYEPMIVKMAVATAAFTQENC